MSNREYIGKRIAEIRQANGLSQRALSDLCGVTYQNINKIELGRYSVGLDVLSKIINALGYELRIEKAEG